ETDKRGGDYNPTNDFKAFPGGAEKGPWNSALQNWTGLIWDTDTNVLEGSGELGPTWGRPQGQGNNLRWVIRRWDASVLTFPKQLTLRYFAAKEEVGGAGSRV